MPPRIEITFDLTRQVADAIADQVGKAVMKTAMDIEAGAKAKAPVDTGKLRGSIQARMDGEMQAVVEASAEYAAAVEFGTGVFTTDPDAPHQPIVIRPRNKKALFWPGAEHPVAQVVQQGQPARPYLTPAAEAARPGFVAVMQQAIREALGGK